MSMSNEDFTHLAGEEAIRQITRHFDLTRDQAVAAIKALVPAFAEAMKRMPDNAGDTGAATPDWSRAFSPDGIAEGNALLGQIFGSKDVSRAIAEHATRISQVNAETLKKLLPVLAPLLVNRMNDPDDPLARILSAFFGQGSTATGPMDFAEAFLKAMQPNRPAPPQSGTEKMMEAGMQMQKDYFNGIQSIFEQLMPTQKK